MVDATPFRTPTLSCPRCPSTLTPGELGFCGRCDGVWIPEAALRDRVSKMQERPAPQLRWASESRLPLPCIACRSPMETLRLFDVPIDRCKAHGVWFDRDELQTVLLESRKHAPPPPSTKSESTLGTVGDGIDLFGGVIEIIGGLFDL